MREVKNITQEVNDLHNEILYWILMFGFPAKTIQDRPSSINQSLNRGTKFRHTLQLKFTLAISSLLNMHLTPRLHLTIERLRQFIHLFTETNYLQTMRKNKTGICSPTMPTAG